MKIHPCKIFFPTLAISGILLAGNVVSKQAIFPLITQVHASEATYSDNQLKEWLRSTGNEMVAIVNADYSKTEQKEKFLPILNKYVDVDGIAKFCLGRFWRVATSDQQQEYTQLFHQVLVNSITNRLGEYKGVSFTIGEITSTEGNKKSIQTTLKRPKQPDVVIQWIIEIKNGSPMVVDIIGENASLAVTQRGDYTSFIARHQNDVSALIAALKRQLQNHS